MSLKLNGKYVQKFVNEDEMSGIKAQVETAAKIGRASCRERV